MGAAFDAQALAALRRDYEANAETLAAIAARFSISPTALRRLAREMGFAPRPRGAPFTRKSAPAAPPQSAPPLKPLDLGAMAGRVQGAVERELGRIHDQLEQGHDVERQARTLASLVKTLGDLARLEAARGAGAPAADDAGAWDIADLRAELARRIDRMAPDEPA